MIAEEQTRRERLQALRDAHIDPYPASATRTHTIATVLADFARFETEKTTIRLVGRIKTFRKHGGLTFLQLEDGSGVLQVAVKKDNVGADVYDLFGKTTDMGDFLECSGPVFVTQKGERTLQANTVQLLTKTLLPMPEKWHGLTDVETRYRQRYLDLMSNKDVRDVFTKRSAIVRTIRRFLEDQQFMEVETPILQAIPGGASARPFITHHNALNQDFYLRIAPELYLKRCLVGGFERVFEVARCFRNEGIDHTHNPEFTQVEGYCAYMNYEQLMVLLESLFVHIIQSIGLDPTAVPFQDTTLNFSTPWPRITFRDLLIQKANLDIRDYPTREALAKVAKERHVDVADNDSVMTIVDNLYKKLARPQIVQPVYIIDYPAEISPLAKRKASDPSVVEMFQLVCGGGVELCKAFSELNDPLDQEARFDEQRKARAAGDEEAQFADDDFVTALKHGMPPTAGFGIGIDRLCALLLNATHLKEVILFPTLRSDVS